MIRVYDTLMISIGFGSNARLKFLNLRYAVSQIGRTYSTCRSDLGVNNHLYSKSVRCHYMIGWNQFLISWYSSELMVSINIFTNTSKEPTVGIKIVITVIY